MTIKEFLDEKYISVDDKNILNELVKDCHLKYTLSGKKKRLLYIEINHRYRFYDLGKKLIDLYKYTE